MSSIIKQYDTKIDSKNRCTIQGSNFNYYHVTEFNDGHIELFPRVLVDPALISRDTLNMMDKSVENFKNGKVLDPIDLSKYLENE